MTVWAAIGRHGQGGPVLFWCKVTAASYLDLEQRFLPIVRRGLGASSLSFCWRSFTKLHWLRFSIKLLALLVLVAIFWGLKRSFLCKMEPGRITKPQFMFGLDKHFPNRWMARSSANLAVPFACSLYSLDLTSCDFFLAVDQGSCVPYTADS